MDLDSLSRAELQKLRADVDKALASLADREKRRALEAAEKAAAEHGFRLAELTGIAPARGRVAKAPGKYRNPANANQTWTGRGRRPAWINAALEAGIDIETFRI